MDIVFATSNPGKAREARHILGKGLRISRLELDEIQSMYTAEVAKHKAREAYRIIGRPVFVEDTGLHIKSLNGFPGPLVKWALRGMGYEGICRAVGRGRDRGAYAETCVALCDGKRVRSFTARIYGTVPLRPVGSGGFGWDCIFVPNGHKRTFAQMDLQEKSAISMRGRALLRLKGFIGARDKTVRKRIK